MENKTYVIKIKKTAENGEKYFVNQTYKCKDALTKYEEKMAFSDTCNHLPFGCVSNAVSV